MVRPSATAFVGSLSGLRAGFVPGGGGSQAARNPKPPTTATPASPAPMISTCRRVSLCW